LAQSFIDASWQIISISTAGSSLWSDIHIMGDLAAVQPPSILKALLA